MSARKGSYRPPAARAQAWRPTAKLRNEAVTSIRSLSKELEHHHPRMGTHQHLKDAANALERGHHEGAVRHLTAAIANFQPQSLYRHGMVTDAEYHQAKAHMDAVHRHLLLVKDLQDHEAHNQSLTAYGANPEEDPTQGYGPAANSQKPMARGGNARAMGAPDDLPTGGTDKNVAEPKSITNWHITKQIAASNGDLTTGYTLELSAETARLAVTPAPRGKPGGPGLYRVKGMGHTPYLQQVVKALIEKRGMSPDKAYAIARGSIRKWAAKSKHAEVRAAAGAAEAGELARQARAHAHSITGRRGVIALGWQDELRGDHGEWVKALGELADKLDSDHPGEGLGAHVREAQSAVRGGDIARAGTKLQEAKTALRDGKFYRGGRGDATYRAALGNSYALEGHIRHANAVFDTAQQDAQPARKHKFFATEEGMSTTIDLVGAGGWSHGFKRAGDPGFDPTPHKGGHRSSRASAVKKGDRLMASFEGGRAGFGPHRVLSVEHHTKGGKHRVTLRMMHEGSGKVYKQTVKAHSQVEHVKPGDFNRGEGGKLSPAEHVQRLHDLADKAERSAMLRNQDPNLGGAARPLYGATDDQEGYGSFRRRGGSETANALRSAARAVGNGDYERARQHMESARTSARSEFRHGEDARLADQIGRHAGTLGSLPRGNSSSRIDTSEKANRAREEAARAYAARSAPARRRVPPGPPQVKAGSSSMGRRNAEDLSGPRLTPVQRTAFGQETRAAAARRTARNRRRNAGLSNWDDIDRAIELAVLAPKA